MPPAGLIKSTPNRSRWVGFETSEDRQVITGCAKVCDLGIRSLRRDPDPVVVVAEARTGRSSRARRRDPPDAVRGLDNSFGVAFHPGSRDAATGTGDPSGRRVYRAVRAYVVEEPADRAMQTDVVVRACRSETTSHVVGSQNRPADDAERAFGSARQPRRQDQVQRPATFRDDLQLRRRRLDPSPAVRPTRSSSASRPSRPSYQSVRAEQIVRRERRRPRGFGRETRTAASPVIVAPGRSRTVALLRAGVALLRVDATATTTASKRRPHSPRGSHNETVLRDQIVDRSRLPVPRRPRSLAMHENPARRATERLNLPRQPAAERPRPPSPTTRRLRLLRAIPPASPTRSTSDPPPFGMVPSRRRREPPRRDRTPHASAPRAHGTRQPAKNLDRGADPQRSPRCTSHNAPAWSYRD